jgi:hypothetical protein
MVIASTKAVYIFSAPDSTDALFTSYFSAQMRTTFFGDLISYKQGDQFATAIVGSVATGTSSETFGEMKYTDAIPSTGHYIARPHLQIGGSTGFCKILMLPYVWASTSVIGGSTFLPVPDPMLGELITVPVDVFERATGNVPLRRARLPGAYSSPHGPVFNAFDMFTGTGDLAGKTLMCMPAYASSNAGQYLLDVSPSAW